MNNNLDPQKLFQEDTVRALLPPECYTYMDGQLLVTKEGLACLCIGVISGKLEGNKAAAQKLLDTTGFTFNPQNS